ncbi:protealysin inhibitor emfourin [Microbacterium karelineae]|uniref:protealysin inhibitor emfourin n=1 Tax=Microbacterium karelineae TaxID=2654283 RepID=UPI0012EAEB6F|nr:protealysin inhibitor emfourin [Microbacterium karelineae]
MPRRDDDDPRDADGAAEGEAEERIVVIRSGGFAGLRREWAVSPRDDAAAWIPLVEACPWNEVPSDATARDRYIWRIEVHLLTLHHAADVPESSLTGAWQALVERVRDASE